MDSKSSNEPPVGKRPRLNESNNVETAETIRSKPWGLLDKGIVYSTTLVVFVDSPEVFAPLIL
ncbi:hypothetical protein N7452_004955 [Penicillium brevicompactum]|uniref:Uncharacterized protein n=1 Tax=Penicillium brevicompactum TaxID=5074 RepID=A0A9W9UEP3_PENBR|nr:hypothetical protein N7452_004955 [Penicillium brevicompactum]